MRLPAIRIGALAAIVAIGTLLFLWLRMGSVERRATNASPVASSTPRMPRASAPPQPGRTTHFLPQLPPPQLVPPKPNLFKAPAKAGNPP